MPRQEIRAAYGGNPAWLVLPYRGALISTAGLIGVWIVNAVRSPINFDVGFLVFMVSYVVLATFVARAYVLLDQSRMGMLYLLMTPGCFPALPFLVIGMAVRCAHVFYRFGIPFGLFGTARETAERFLEDRCCRQCGYDLTGNVSGRCPECGTATVTTPPKAEDPARIRVS